MDEQGEEKSHGDTASSAMREGDYIHEESRSGPAHGNRVQTLSTEPHGPAGLDLNLLASLDEPEELMRTLQKIAQSKNGKAWMVIDHACRQAMKAQELLNQPEVANP